MTPREFSRAMSGTRMPPDSATARAARLVLVDGFSRSEAARRVGVDRPAVVRAVKRLQPVVPCPHCHGSGNVPA